MSNDSEHLTEHPRPDLGLYVLPCVCGTELVEVSEDAIKLAALDHMREHQARGDKPGDFADAEEGS